MRDKKHMVLATIVQPYGQHPAAWLMATDRNGASVDIDYYREVAKLAEKGKFDLFFLADTPAARTEDLTAWSRAPVYMNIFEPITLLATLAASTSRIGLGATASTGYYEPYNIARLYASLDHLSHGRAAWNVVTSSNDYAARNFGQDKLPPHAERYARAKEFYKVVEALWDTWEDDAFIYDRKQKLVFDPAKFHKVSHQGDYFKVNGGLNIQRPPQGRPLIIQAGASESGKELAAETADVVYGVGATAKATKAYYDDLKGRMAKYGRDRDALKVLSGFTIVMGDTEDEAREKWNAWQDMVHPDVGLVGIKMDLEVDLFDLPLDRPVPKERVPKTANFTQSYHKELSDMVDEGLTLGEMIRRYNRNKAVIFGSYRQIVDQMEAWVAAGASDGFILNFPTIPSSMADFVEKAVPELQRRGIFHRDYHGATLRDQLGLERPASRYQAAS